MRKFNLNGCSFKPIELKKHKTPLVHKPSHKTLTYCICIETEPNVFKAYTNVKSDLEFPDTMVLDFTPRSYELKGKTKVFTIKKYENKSICVLRDSFTATHFPGLSTQYTPFKNEYVYSGYIVKIDKIPYFDVVEIFEHRYFCNNLVANIKIPNYEK